MTSPSVPTTEELQAQLAAVEADLMARDQAIDEARSLLAKHPGLVFDALLGKKLDELIAEKKKPVDAVPTPFPTWNAACRDEGGGIGLAKGWHVLVAGIPGLGKSVLALNTAVAAVRHGLTVTYISLEMSLMQLATRLMAIYSGISIQRLEHGQSFSESDARSAARYLDELHERTGGQVRVNRRPISSLSDIAAAIRLQYEFHGCRFVIVDYLQLAWGGSASSMFENIQEVSHTVRHLAAELKVVSLGLSQFNRETSTNRSESPTPQGLMGGSVLENDADQVLLLDHSSFERTDWTATGQVLLAKNRHGPQVKIPVKWDYRTLQVRESMEEPESEVA